MIKQRYSIDDLLIALRNNGYRGIHEIEYAILETNGNLSVFPKDKKNDSEYPFPIIVDGVVDIDSLKEEMYKRIDQYGIGSKEVMEISQLIDLLINVKFKS